MPCVTIKKRVGGDSSTIHHRNTSIPLGNTHPTDENSLFSKKKKETLGLFSTPGLSRL